MQWRLDIGIYFCLRPLNEISIRDRHPLLNAGIIDQYIQVRMFFGYPLVKRLAIFRNGHVADACNERWKFAFRLFQGRLTPSTNDYGIAFLDESFGEAEADARCATGDQDLVIGELHSQSFEQVKTNSIWLCSAQGTIDSSICDGHCEEWKIF